MRRVLEADQHDPVAVYASLQMRRRERRRIGRHDAHLRCRIQARQQRGSASNADVTTGTGSAAASARWCTARKPHDVVISPQPAATSP